MNARGPTRLVALADVFPQRVEKSFETLNEKHARQLDVPPDRRFVGFDAFKRTMEVLGKGDLVLLARPAAFSMPSRLRPVSWANSMMRRWHIFASFAPMVTVPASRSTWSQLSRESSVGRQFVILELAATLGAEISWTD